MRGGALNVQLAQRNAGTFFHMNPRTTTVVGAVTLLLALGIVQPVNATAPASCDEGLADAFAYTDHSQIAEALRELRDDGACNANGANFDRTATIAAALLSNDPSELLPLAASNANILDVLAQKACPAGTMSGTISVYITVTVPSISLDPIVLQNQVAAGVAKITAQATTETMSVALTQAYGITGVHNVGHLGAGAFLVAGVPIPFDTYTASATCGHVINELLKLVPETCTIEAEGMFDGGGIDIHVDTSGDNVIPCS